MKHKFFDNTFNIEKIMRSLYLFPQGKMKNGRVFGKLLKLPLFNNLHNDQ
jgi:hypothetical protein